MQLLVQVLFFAAFLVVVHSISAVVWALLVRAMPHVDWSASRGMFLVTSLVGPAFVFLVLLLLKLLEQARITETGYPWTWLLAAPICVFLLIHPTYWIVRWLTRKQR